MVPTLDVGIVGARGLVPGGRIVLPTPASLEMISMEIMNTSPENAPVQTLKPISDDKNLLMTNAEDAAGSCCGGACCSS